MQQQSNFYQSPSLAGQQGWSQARAVAPTSVDTWTGAQTWWETGSESRFYQLKDPANTWSLSW